MLLLLWRGTPGREEFFIRLGKNLAEPGLPELMRSTKSTWIVGARGQP